MEAIIAYLQQQPASRIVVAIYCHLVGFCNASDTITCCTPALSLATFLEDRYDLHFADRESEALRD